MKDYASELFDIKPQPQDTPGTRDYAKELLDESVQRNFQPTAETSAITTEPIQKFTGEGGPGASFISHMKAGFVDDPITKVRIYSADRFPGMGESERMARYRIKDGEILFKDLDNKWYSESPDSFQDKAKKFIAETTGDPSVVLGTAGQIAGGTPGAMAGAGTGAYLKRVIGSKVFGEPENELGTMLEVSANTALGALGTLPGRAVAKGVNEVGISTAGLATRRVAKAFGKKDLQNIDFRAAAELKERVKNEYGIELFDAQTTESRRLLDKINLYGDLPATADAIQSAKKIQDEQAYSAVKKFFSDISPDTQSLINENDPLYLGAEVVKSAQNVIQKEVDRRVQLAKPLYDKAFAAGTKVDLEPHMQAIEAAMEKWAPTSPEYAKLQRFKKLWLKRDGETLQDDLVVLDRNKKSVDAMLKPSVSDTPVDNAVNKEIRDIKNNILADIDKDNEAYAKARKVWGDTQDDYDYVAGKTRISALSKLEGDKVTQASKVIWDKSGNSPALMAKIKSRLQLDNPEAWEAVVRTHLEDIFNRTTESADLNGSKVFNAFWRNTVGDPKERELLSVGMGDKFNNLVDFADVLRRVGLIARKESTTATRQASLAEEQWYGKSKIIASATRPLMTYQRVLGDKVNEFLGDEAKKKLVTAMLDPRMGDQLRRIKVLGPETEKGIQATSTLFSLILGGEYSEKLPELVKSHRSQYDYIKE